MTSSEAISMEGLERGVRRRDALVIFFAAWLLALLAWQLAPRCKRLDARDFLLRDQLWRRRAELAR